MYIVKKTPAGTLLALDGKGVWTTELKSAVAFSSTYGRLILKSEPGAFATEQHPATQQAAERKKVGSSG